MKIEGDAFLITADSTYQEIANYLVMSDPHGVVDLVGNVLEMKPELVEEIKSWEMFK